MSFEPLEYVRHIVAEADYLTAQTTSISKDDFLKSETLRRAFVRSLEVWPVGGLPLAFSSADAILRLGSAIFEFSLRLALPIAGLLLLTELALALLSRLQTQLQLLSLAFPVKLLGSLAALAALAPAMALIYQQAFRQSLLAFERIMAR